MSSWISKFTTTFRSNWLFRSHRSGSRLGISLPIWVSLRAAPRLRAATDLNTNLGESNSAAGAAQPARVWKEPLSITMGAGAEVRHWAGSSYIGSELYLESWNEKILYIGFESEAILKACHYNWGPCAARLSHLCSGPMVPADPSIRKYKLSDFYKQRIDQGWYMSGSTFTYISVNFCCLCTDDVDNFYVMC